MRALALCTSLAVSGAGTVTSTPILLIAGGHFANYGDSNVPGEDMAFPSSGTAVVALSIMAQSAATGDLLTSGASINILTSNNYFKDSGSGETFASVASYAPAGGISTKTPTVFLDRVPLGEAVCVQIVSVTTADTGFVTAYLLNN